MSNQNIAVSKSYILKGVLLVYMVAFTSLYVQVQSLFGDGGIVPLRDFLAKTNTPKKSTEAFNILKLAPALGISYGNLVELLCLFGVFLSFMSLVVKQLTNSLSFGLLWYIYYSICQYGQGFMSFQSDLMLLEVGFFAVILAPLLPTAKRSNADHDHITMFMLRWLTFRYFVSNTLSFYLENDKAAYSLTAIPLVAQGIQFPSLFSWHIANLPSEYLKVLQAYEHVIKLSAPFLCIFDLKFSRQLAFYSLITISVPSILFFNYGWRDMLISICLLAYFKDSYSYPGKQSRQSTFRTLLDIVLVTAYVAMVSFVFVKFFGFRLDNGLIAAQVKFSHTQLKLLADHLVPISLALGSLGFLSSVYTTFVSSKKRTPFVKNFLITLLLVPIFLSTFPTLTRLTPGLETKIKPLAQTKDLNRMVAPYMLSNNYIFISKISSNYGEVRPELQIQGRASAEDPIWQQFDLRFKPGQPSSELARVVPHLPRIDLKMWYAARSSIQNNQWLQTFAYRIMSGESDVMNALSPTGSPNSKVNQVRVALYNYKYSSKARLPFAGYWSQSKFVSEYMPATSAENLRFAVKANGISLAPKMDDSKQGAYQKLLNKYLQISSDYIRGIDHTTIIWTTLALASVSVITRRS